MACMHVSRLHTVFYISAHLKKQYDGWLEYSSDEGTMVAVWASLVKSLMFLYQCHATH